MPNVVRRHFNSSNFNRARYIAAVRQMRIMPAPGFPNLYDKYIQWHAAAGFNAVAHLGLAFLAWHRAFLWEFEKDLQSADIALGNNGAIGLAWWDWTNDTSTNPADARGRIWQDTFMGPTGTPPSNEVMSGPFVRANWPPGPLLPLPTPQFLRRNLGGGILASTADITYIMSLPNFDVPPYTDAAPDTSFRNVLEGFQRRPGGTSNYHNSAHGWIGGNMNNVLTSPYEPAFWLNHGNVDRLWARWQVSHPRLADQWPSDAQIDAAYPMAKPANVLKLNDPILPWDGSAGTRIWTPRSVLRWQRMGPAGEHQYRHNTDPPGSFNFS